MREPEKGTRSNRRRHDPTKAKTRAATGVGWKFSQARRERGDCPVPTFTLALFLATTLSVFNRDPAMHPMAKFAPLSDGPIQSIHQ